jgi:hypothetical protein
MAPGKSPDRPKAATETGGGPKVIRALWGAVSGGIDVTARVAAMAKDGTLVVDATIEALGDDGVAGSYKRLELEYACKGKTTVVLAVLGERVIIDSQGNNRTQRAAREAPRASATQEAKPSPGG